MLKSGSFLCCLCQKQMQVFAFLHLIVVALVVLRFATAEKRSKYEYQPVQQTETFLQRNDFAKLQNSKYSKLLQTPLNETHYFKNDAPNSSDEPLETLSQWHIHRFHPSELRENKVEKKKNKSEGSNLSEREESTQVILHCFDCDTEPPISPYKSAVEEQKEKFYFHKVNVDTSYDPFTKRPYHHSVLAVKAIPPKKPNNDGDITFISKNISYSHSSVDQTSTPKPNKPYFTFQNNSNTFRINSVNYKPFITNSEETDKDERNNNNFHSYELSVNKPRDHFNHRRNKKTKQHISHNNNEEFYFMKNKHHKTSIRKYKRRKNHHLNSKNNQINSHHYLKPLQRMSRMKKQNSRSHDQTTKNGARISQLEDFPEQLHFLHRWLLKLDHQSYQKTLRQERQNLRLLNSPSRLKNS